MKVKLDFVTNSSSTCYIACVPSTLKPFKSVEGLHEWDYDGQTEEEALETVNDGIKYLQNGNTLWREDNSLFWTIQRYLGENGFILTSVDAAGGDGCDVIEPLTIKLLEEFLERNSQ
ncbi:MAG: hypothetical protein KAJ19_21130 [Gammaproteobacteria bacterium]|nr:hypothetical protein [Gammaproteobacteria bacterium]